MERAEGFLKHLQISGAATTYLRKGAQIKNFLHYLSERKKHYCEAKKEGIEAYLLQLTGSQQSKQQYLQVIKEFYGYIEGPNPTDRIKPISIPWKKSRLAGFRVPSVYRVAQVIARANEESTRLGKRNALMLELAYGSGLRRIELIRLNVEDVDLVEKTVHVWGKGDKERVVPMTESAVKAVREYLICAPLVRGPLLRTSRGRRLEAMALDAIFKSKIGIRPHLFRHACAAHMLQNGCNIRYIQKLLGHERLDSTQIYTQVDKRHLRQVVDRSHPRARAE